MKFANAVEKSIKAYLDGKLPEELMKSSGEDIIYTPEYMDELEEQLSEVEPEVEETDNEDN
tara:strand:- start:373 stop:555 length:183 start_codon:yes stop_codon:yes gene_type:complete